MKKLNISSDAKQDIRDLVEQIRDALHSKRVLHAIWDDLEIEGRENEEVFWYDDEANFEYPEEDGEYCVEDVNEGINDFIEYRICEINETLENEGCKYRLSEDIIYNK